MNTKKVSSFKIAEIFAAAETSAGDISQYIRSIVNAGEKVFRQGGDLVRLLPSGEIIRVQGFFDLADQLSTESIELEATLSWMLGQSQFPTGQKLVAQASTGSVSDAIADPQVLSSDSAEMSIVNWCLATSNDVTVMHAPLMAMLSPRPTSSR